MAAWGAGVDSTAMIIELVSRGEAPDVVLPADTGSKRPDTGAFIPLFRAWMDDHGVANHAVRYEPRRSRAIEAMISCPLSPQAKAGSGTSMAATRAAIGR